MISPTANLSTPTARGRKRHPSFDEVPNDNPEDELGPWVGCVVRATDKPDDLLAENGVTSWILRQGKVYWKQARMIAKQHEGRWDKAYLQQASSDINQAN